MSLSVVEAHSGTLVQQLLTSDVDLAITTGASNPDLRSTPLFTEDIMAVMSSDHPLALKSDVTVNDLAQTKLLLPLADNPLRGHIARAFAAEQLPLRSQLEVGSSALVQAMAAADVGVALIPATAAADRDSSEVAVRPISNMEPRAVALTMRRSAQPSRALDAVAAIIEQTARTAASTMPGCKATPATGATSSPTQATEAPADVLSIH